MRLHSLKSWFGIDSRKRHTASSTRLRVETLEARDVPSATVPDVDLTTRGSQGVINDAIFRQADPQPTGTGVIRSFLRIQGASAKSVVQQGYNTDARPLQFDDNKSPQFTRSMSLDGVPLVNIGGELYRELLLDINQKNSQPLLSLDELRIYTGNAGNLSGYDATTHTLGGQTAVYDMDAGGDHWVLMNYRLNTGSGSGDMFLYVPNRLFGNGGPYVYLYSKFGEHYASNSGFQEWAAGLSPLTAATASISGVRYNDLNGNGVRDAGEPGLANVVVYLDADKSGTLDQNEVYTITDANGNFTFNNLTSGADYIVRATKPDDTWTETGPEPFEVFISVAGQSVTGVELGVIQMVIVPQ